LQVHELESKIERTETLHAKQLKDKNTRIEELKSKQLESDENDLKINAKQIQQLETELQDCSLFHHRRIQVIFFYYGVGLKGHFSDTRSSPVYSIHHST
jgi:hypothetical protein